ncbi:MAG: hypothetical protein JXQ71_04135 [Verrucomicrobia bacterium]|nr:hypothetical protein [Verrucomicrobiota bacterium]
MNNGVIAAEFDASGLVGVRLPIKGPEALVVDVVPAGALELPALLERAIDLAAMHTAVDPRYGTRQKAPIGDTGRGTA